MYRRISNEGFPGPVRLAGVKGVWLKGDVLKWLRNDLRRRDPDRAELVLLEDDWWVGRA